LEAADCTWNDRSQARHIEVQIFGDGRGSVAALGERDCSVQRRNQKVIERNARTGTRERSQAKAFAGRGSARQGGNYQSAGTVEFIYDKPPGISIFSRSTTRLQVEHGRN